MENREIKVLSYYIKSLDFEHSLCQELPCMCVAQIFCKFYFFHYVYVYVEIYA